MDKQIELAKSWFQLAMVFATLAGMTIVAAGIFWTPISEYADIIAKTKDICSVFIGQNVINYSFGDCSSDFLKSQFESIKSSSRISIFLIFLAILLATNSLLFWFQGYWKMKKEEYTPLGFSLIVIILFDLLAFIFLYFKVF